MRIENRVLPSGPTVKDEIANAAFWYGLMNGMESNYDDVRNHFDFEDIKNNFNSAARFGLNAQFTWAEGEIITAQKLLLKKLIPLAEKGLRHAKINQNDIEQYLSIIEKRVSRMQTGSQWILKSLSKLRNTGTYTEQLNAITAAMYSRQQDGKPVHEWKLASIEEAGGWAGSYMRVEQYMDTDLYTVNQGDLLELVANLMVWKYVRHIMVEDNQHRLVGIVTHRTMLKYIGQGAERGDPQNTEVSKIMYKDPIIIPPETATLDAIKIMRDNNISCLPVLKDDRLIGLVTENQFMDITRQLMEKKLKN